MEIWIDQRERAIVPHFDSYLKGSTNFPISVKVLTAGDYAIIYRDWIIALIERKTWIDLAATMTDKNRKFNYEKMLEERKKYDCQVFYLIEGQPSGDRVHRMPVSTLIAHLDHLLIDHAIVTIYSRGPNDTPNRIIQLAKNYTTAHTAPLKLIDQLLAEEGVDPEQKIGGQSAAESLQTPKVKADHVIFHAMWCSIEGVSTLSQDAFETNHIQLHGLLLGQYQIDDLSHIKYRSGATLGTEQIKKIIKNAVKPETHIKVVSQIPRVSQAIAKTILETYSLESIIFGRTTAEQIANLKYDSGRRYGEALANLVVKYLSISPPQPTINETKPKYQLPDIDFGQIKLPSLSQPKN